MSDIIYYKNGEETFRISPPTVGTKCPETKLEVKKMNEKEQLKAQIQELQEQLQKLEEKSPVEEAFKKVYGEYPMGEPFWVVFQKGYKSAQKDYKVGEYQPTPQKPSMINCIIKGPPPNGYPSWSEWYNEMGSNGILHKLKISSLGEGEFQPTPQEPEKLKTLYQFLGEYKYGVSEDFPDFDDDEFSILDWHQIFIEYLYECCDILDEDDKQITVKINKFQIGGPTKWHELQELK